ncbi:MAG: tetratricopeptide repeat protein [Candidatus Eiseniibacteriota bacterium]
MNLRKPETLACLTLVAALSFAGCAHLPGGSKKAQNTSTKDAKAANAKAASTKKTNAKNASAKSAMGGETTRANDDVAEARRQTDLLPHEPYWPYRLARLRLEADSTAGAETALQIALARDPFYLPALVLQSRLDYRQGRHLEAIERLESVRARATANPANGAVPPELLTALAIHYDAIDRVDLAAPLAEGAAGNGGSSVAPSLAYLALRGDTPEKAAEPALAALKNDSKSAVNQNNYGITRLRAGDPDAARKAFIKAVEIDPRLPGPYYNLAIVEKYYALDDEAAARWFRQYRERANEDPDHLAEAIGREPGPVGAREKE